MLQPRLGRLEVNLRTLPRSGLPCRHRIVPLVHSDFTATRPIPNTSMASRARPALPSLLVARSSAVLEDRQCAGEKPADREARPTSQTCRKPLPCEL